VNKRKGGLTTTAYRRPGTSAALPATTLVRRLVDLNLCGTFLPCQVFGLGMTEHGEGIILNIASINTVRPLTRIPAYAAAKAAVVDGGFTAYSGVCGCKIQGRKRRPSIDRRVEL